MQVTWFGHSAFRLDFAGKTVLIDPFFTGNPAFMSDPKAAVQGVTHIVLTHGHADHVGDAIDILRRIDDPPALQDQIKRHLTPLSFRGAGVAREPGIQTHKESRCSGFRARALRRAPE